MTDETKAPEEKTAIQELESKMQETRDSLQEFIEKGREEIKEAGEASAETKAAVEKLLEKAKETDDRITEVEQRAANFVEASEDEQKSIGELIVESEDFQRIQKDGGGSAKIHFKTAIVNATPSLTQPLTPGTRLDRVIKEPDRPLRIRDLLPTGRTDSNIVWFPKEDTFTNAAAVVRNTSVSPVVAAENVTKPESALTFTNDSEAVVTIAHFIPVSKQAMDDSPFLASYLDQKMVYGYQLTEEEQLLNGTGLTGYITGLNEDSTAYAQLSPEIASTKIDKIRDAKRQAEQANYMPSVVILNPADWAEIELTKETGGMYVFANPQGVATPVLWGMRVVISNTQTAGTATVFDPQVAQIFDREGLNVQVSFEDSTNFQKNMVTVRAEGRLALVIYNKGGIIKVTL